MSTTVSSDPVTKTFGSLTIAASRTVDGGYAINTFARTGGHRYDELSGFTTTDRNLYRRVYRLIAEGGMAGVHPDGIHQALVDTLTGDLQVAMRRRDGRQIEALNAALDRLATPAQALADRQMLAGIADTIRAGRTRDLSGFGRIRAAHAAQVAADRAAFGQVA